VIKNAFSYEWKCSKMPDKKTYNVSSQDHHIDTRDLD